MKDVRRATVADVSERVILRGLTTFQGCDDVGVLSDYTGPDLLCSMVFSPFLVIFSFFIFGSCGRLSWFNCQLSSARYYSIFTN